MSNIDTDHGGITHLTIKVIMIGDSAVGKSTLLDIYKDGEKYVKQQNRQPTIGVDFYTSVRSLNVNNRLYEITYQIWDTAGQERFRAVSASYFRGIDGVLFVFEAPATEFEQSYKSLRNVNSWFDFSQLHSDPGQRQHIVHALCMSKLDVIANNDTLRDHVGNQCKVTLEKICPKEQDIKRAFNVTRDRPEKIVQMFDYLLKHIAETKIRAGLISSGNTQEKEKTTNTNHSLPRRRSAQKLFVVSIENKDSTATTPGEDLVRREETGTCCSSS